MLYKISMEVHIYLNMFKVVFHNRDPGLNPGTSAPDPENFRFLQNILKHF